MSLVQRKKLESYRHDNALTKVVPTGVCTSVIREIDTEKVLLGKVHPLALTLKQLIKLKNNTTHIL